jgi:uncharacterized protein DUF6263
VKRFHAFAVLVLLCVSAAAASAQTVTLRYGWAKGESRTYRVTTQTDSAITGMPGAPGPMTTSQTMTQVVKLTAEEVVPWGTITLRQTFQSVRMEMSGPMGKLVVDSAAPDTGPGANPMAQPLRQLLNAMIGESVQIVMAPDGAVRQVDGAARIADKVTKVMSADPAAGQAGQGLKTMLSDDALKNTFEQSFPKLSSPPAKVGDVWTGQFAMGNPVIGRIAGGSAFTLTAIEGTAEAPLARIAVKLTLTQEVVPPPSGPMNMVMTLEASKGEGEIRFDVGRGHIVRSTMRTDMPSAVTMDGPDGKPVMMHNKTTTTMTMELVEK